MRSRLLQWIATLSTLTVAGCLAQATSSDPSTDVTLTDHVHMMPFRDSDSHDPRVAAPPAPVAPAGAHLDYHGGKVIQNVQITQVLYGTGTYIPELTAATGVNMVSAYSQMVGSGVFDWLSEYNTASPAQTIGRGSVGGSLQIAPAAARNGTTITDASIQAEIAAQINSGVLPAPNDNQLYMVHFPSGKTISQGGASSCVAGGFCAYHGTFKIGAQNVYYGVLPALTGGCATGCGGGTTFQNTQSVASHELIEAVTDAEVGLATVIGPPLAWYDATNGEIGDICNGQQGTFVGTDSNTYTIQKEFSNQQNDCITTRAVTTTPDFNVALSPTSATVAAGGSTTVSVTTATINSSTQSIALSVAGLPSGVTGAFNPATVTAGGSSTLTLTAAATASGAATYTVTGTSGSTSHTANGSLSVSSGGGTTVLGNGVALTNLSGASGQQSQFSIVVPAGQSLLTVKISGGTGDADLYVRAGTAPTLQTFDCRPFISGNNETCTVNSPAANTYFIMVNGFSAYTGVTLVATFGADATTALTNNVPVTGLSGASGSQKLFKLTVPAGQTSVVFQISGGTGDADLYVRRGAAPTTATFDCRPFLTGNAETCTFNSPVAADYFVMIRGFAAYAGVTLVGHFP
ncbi:MAG TPA: PPC domain-containing protein [Kofleriaceae bacterium]